jgi:hypothetical protein
MRNRNQTIETDYRYTSQQQALREICDELGLVYFRPNYHAKKGDCNTVLIYTKEDNQTYVCALENTECNGYFSLDFMNYGRIDLRGLKTKEILKDHINLSLEKYKKWK